MFSSCVYGTEASACEASCSREPLQQATKGCDTSRVLAFSQLPEKCAAALNCSIHQDKASVSLLCALGPLARTKLSFGDSLLGSVDSKAPPEAARLNLTKLVNMFEC